MKICIDIQPAVTQRAGVGQYTKRLVQHLDSGRQDDEVYLVYFDFKKQGIPFPTPGMKQHAIRWCPGRIAQLAWKKTHWPPYDAFAGPADVYHFPNFVIPPLRRGKAVVTIHDMSFLRFPEFAEERNRTHLAVFIKETARRADAIITISRFSAAEITDLLDVPRERIFPVHLGISEHFSRPSEADIQRTRDALSLQRPYLLFVGTLEPRKNIPFLIEVFEKLDDFDGDLVIAGGMGWKYEPILERIGRSPHADRIRHVQYIGEDHLCGLYAGAELLVFPSHYEGFGFPPLEAMACGTPVLSSTGGSLPEVVGDAAVCLDAFDSDAWASQARTLITDTDTRKRLIAAGYAKSATYTWADTARKTWDVYRKVAR
jgi:glycosyltransferase involved in cell wall biosynthesis